MVMAKRVDLIRRLIKAQARPKLLHGLQKLGVAEAAVLLRSLDPHEIRACLEALFDDPFLKTVLTEVPEERLGEVLSTLSGDEVVKVLSQMPASWDWSYLKFLPGEKTEALLSQLAPPLQKAIRKISEYPKDSCGEVMESDFIAVRVTVTVEEAIRTLRDNAQMRIFYLYVLDAEGHLLGTVPLRNLVRQDPQTPVSEVMVASHVAVQALDGKEEAAKVVAKYKLMAVPIVDEAHHLLGVIRVDDVMDIVQEEAVEEMYRMAGLSMEDRIFAPWMKTVRKRLPWMLVNLGTALLAASVVGFFQESIEKVVALAIFMPVVAGMGGNGGTQALTVMVRAMTLGEFGRRDIWKIFLKQVGVGGMIGLAAGLVTGLVAWAWQGNLYLGLVLWLAMMANMMIAGFAGSVIPIFLKTLRSDPALGSGVLVTTCTDVFGFLTFLGLATLFLRYLA